MSELQMPDVWMPRTACEAPVRHDLRLQYRMRLLDRSNGCLRLVDHADTRHFEFFKSWCIEDYMI